VNRAPGGRTLFAIVAIVISLALGAAAWSSSTSSSSFGAKQAATHQAAVRTAPIVPFIQTLHVRMKGCECPTVFQLQRALKAAHYRPAKAKSTGYFGPVLAGEVKAFQKAHHISATGVYGKVTHHALAPFYDKTGRARLIQVQHSRRIVAITTAIVNVTTHAPADGGAPLRFAHTSTRQLLPAYPGIPPATDCSGYVTWVYKVVGLPDPSGLGFRPVGWTGTMAYRGVAVSSKTVRIGDLAFYGGGAPYGHVAIVIRVRPTVLVSSHGGPGVLIHPLRYRSLSALRRYF
jgi:peptidoglycan hydrolase-like protein with peptidoglycan-binding domain